jgi:hypothetical protein
MTDTDREREREEDELRQVADQVDPAQGFEVERPTPEQLEEDEVSLYQQPSEADVLEEEAKLDAKRQAEEPD